MMIFKANKQLCIGMKPLKIKFTKSIVAEKQDDIKAGDGAIPAAYKLLHTKEMLKTLLKINDDNAEIAHVLY